MPLGKCDKDRVVWSWQGAPLLRDARCPQCGGELNRTTYLIERYPTREARKAQYGRKVMLVR